MLRTEAVEVERCQAWLLPPVIPETGGAGAEGSQVGGQPQQQRPCLKIKRAGDVPQGSTSSTDTKPNPKDRALPGPTAARLLFSTLGIEVEHQVLRFFLKFLNIYLL